MSSKIGRMMLMLRLTKFGKSLPRWHRHLNRERKKVVEKKFFMKENISMDKRDEVGEQI